VAGSQDPGGQIVTIRELTSLEEFEACLDLQREGFGWSDVDLMPYRFFIVSRHVGGLVLGAFDNDRLAGFLSAIPGVRKGKPYWHSHMLAVTASHRDSGTGTRLKLAQKEHALQKGIHLIEWTFDPLVSRNAYLNIEKLGVIVRRYYPAFYGGDSDRLIAEWWLTRKRPAIAGEQRRIRIPSDFEAAQAQRLRVRGEFLKNIAEDFFVAGFERHGATGDYIFVRGASRADLAD
jgi:predicted GNAT superfamily acetyltransferase